MEEAEQPKVKTCLTRLVSPSLRTREAGLEAATSLVLEHAALELKPLALRRLVAAVVIQWMASLSLAGEKRWTQELEGSLLLLATTVEGLPFQVDDLVLELLQERLPQGAGVDVLRAGVVRLCSSFLKSIGGDNKALLISIIGEQLILIEDMELEAAAVRHISDLLKSTPAIADDFRRVWTEASQQPLLFTAAACALYPSAPASQGLKATLLDLYVKRVVQHKNPSTLTALGLRKLGPFISSLTDLDWESGKEEGLEGALLKTIRKAPEGSSVLVSAAVSQIKPGSLSLSFFAENGAISAALRMLRSQALEVRINGRTLLRGLVASSYASVTKQTIETLQGKGSGGALTQLWQRTEIANALAIIVESIPYGVGRQEKVALASADVLPALFAAIDKESIDDIRSLMACTAGMWLALLSNEIPPSIVDSLKAGLTKVKSQAYLLAIVQAISISKDVLEKIVPVALALCSSSAVKKPVASVQLETIFSYRIIAECCVISSEVVQAAENGKLWAIMASEPCVLYNKACHAIPAAAVSAAEEGDQKVNSSAFLDIDAALVAIRDGQKSQVGSVAESQMAIMSLACERGLSQSLSKGEVPQGALECMLSCLLHASPAVRKFSIKSANAVCDSNPKALPALLQSLRDLLSTQVAQQEAFAAAARQKRAGGDDALVPTVPSVTPASRLSEVIPSLLQSVTPSTSSSKFVPVVLSLCCHPLTTGNSLKRASRLWALVQPRLIDASAACGSPSSLAIEEQLKSLILLEVQDDAEFTRKCGQVATVLLAAESGEWGREFVRTILLPALVVALGKDELIALTPEEVNGFLNPQAALDAAVASVTELAVDLRITNADRKKDGPRSARRGNFGADFVEDEDWAERVKADKLKKAQQQKMGGEGDDVVSKKRAELDVLNGRIGKIVYRARRLLQALGFMIEQCGKRGDSELQPLVHETSVSILSSITHLLPCPLVEKDAMSTLLQLCNSSIDSLMAPLVRDLADTIRLIAIHVSPSQEELVVGTFGTAAGGKKAAKDRENLQKRLKKMVEHSGPPSRLLKGLAAFVGRAGQARYVPSPYTVQLLFPIFRGLLQLPALVTGCELTFTLFDCVWPSTEDLPTELTRLFKPALELCLVVMAQLRVEPSPETTILRIVGQVSRLLQQKNGSLAESALEPLLGDLGMCSAATNVRLACVRALSFVARSSTTSLSNTLSCRLYQAKYDSEDAVKDLATTILGELVSAGRAPSLPAQFIEVYLALFNHETAGVREAASRSLATGLHVHADLAAKVVAELQSVYKGALPTPPSIKTKDKGLDFGLAPKKSIAVADKVVSSTPVAVDDKGANLRCAVATAIATLGSEKSLSQQGNSDLILQVLDFLLTSGVVDPSDDVRNAMVTAGRSFVDGYAATLSTSILSVLNTVLKRQPVKGEDLVAYDHRHEAAVVFLGVTGRHLDKDDPNVVGIVETLVDALKIPAESVQRAVAECLSPLVQAIKTSDRVNEIFSRLMTQVTDAGTYGERRGSAFGISAFVKGMGITSLKQHDVINRLREACENGTVNARQGGFGAFECLSERLGMLFEPYITTIVPILLKSFSHASDHVREAAQLAAKVIMGRLSAHGVKVVLTPILTSLPTETAWKTRQEAIRLLGTMAHCAPKQLASCLPQIIPRLVEAGYDPHPKVKEAAKNAMSDISSVIKNPEVSRLSPVLLAALSDPANKTKEALEALLECEFMHSIDAPSLALLVPILGRALKDRGADLKRKSAAITGNMMTMVSDPKFLVPYLATVLPGLRDCLLDPIPDVRATSAKALGCLIAGVGEEEELADLVPWLTTTLCTEASPVERSGAAQGLAEVCLALGGNRVVDVLQQTLPLHLSTKGAAREGLLWLLSFLPAVLQESFADHIATTLPVVLSGLSDSIDSVREVAMRAGQIMVSTLGKTHTLELLPSLCDGMFDGDWHIRHSSVMLLGELLYLIGDTKASGVVDADDDNDDDGGMGSTSRVSATIRAHLGSETTDHMLASLYIVRSDTSNMVRQSALQVWKSVVSNTPRTLVEIMSELVAQMVEKLSADTSELRIVAGRALGEVVRKLGDRVLPAVVPHLRAGLEGGDLGMREGVCLGLAEILQASTRRQIEDYISVLVPALEQGLCDQSEVVRSQAAKAFQTMCKALGPRAIEDVLPSLITKVAKAKEVGEEPNLALLGLREIVAAKPRDILEYLLPKFFVSPMLESSAFVLGAVADVSGSVLQYHFGLIIPGYCRELIAASADEGATSRLAVLKESASNVMASVSTSGVNSLCHDVKAIVEHENSTKHRRWGCWFLEQFVSRSKASFLDYVPIVLKYLLSRVAETDPPLLQAVSDALAGVSSSVDMESLMSHIDFVRSCISSTASDARHSTSGHLLLNSEGEVELPLFSVPKSLEPLMAIFLHGVMNGNPQVRENAADAIGEIAILTNPAALKPYLIKSTGPLIRVVGDRIPSNVKTSILQVRFALPISLTSIFHAQQISHPNATSSNHNQTLAILLDRGALGLKAFAPQLQTTFVKALSDPSKQTRSKATQALGKLMVISARVDPLLTELASLCSGAESNAIRCSLLEALAVVLDKGGNAATAPILEKVKSVVLNHSMDEDDSLRLAASACSGKLAAYLDAVAVGDLILDLCCDVKDPSSAGRLLSVGEIMRHAGKKLDVVRADAFKFLADGFRSDKPAVINACCCALLSAFTFPSHTGAEAKKEEYTACIVETMHEFVASLVACSSNKDRTEDTRRQALTALKLAAQIDPEAMRTHGKMVLTAVLEGMRDTLNFRIKAQAERIYYIMTEGASQPLVAALCGHSSSEDAAFLRSISKKIAAMPQHESADEW